MPVDDARHKAPRHPVAICQGGNGPSSTAMKLAGSLGVLAGKLLWVGDYPVVEVGPRLASDHQAHRALRYTVLLSQSFLRDAARPVRRDDLSGLVVGELTDAVPTAPQLAISGEFVHRVRAVVPDNQVLRVGARRIVAGVADKHSLGNRLAVGDFPSHDMCSPTFATAYGNDPVVETAGRLPFPALVFTARWGVVAQALFEVVGVELVPDRGFQIVAAFLAGQVGGTQPL